MRADGSREIGVLDKVMGGPLGVIVVPATETPFDNHWIFSPLMVVPGSAFEEFGGFGGRDGRASAVPPKMRLLELSSKIIVPETVT